MKRKKVKREIKGESKMNERVVCENDRKREREKKERERKERTKEEERKRLTARERE